MISSCQTSPVTKAIETPVLEFQHIISANLSAMDYQSAKTLIILIHFCLTSEPKNGRSLRLHRCRVELKKRDPAGSISSGTAEPTHLPINSAGKKKKKSKRKAYKAQLSWYIFNDTICIAFGRFWLNQLCMFIFVRQKTDLLITYSTLLLEFKIWGFSSIPCGKHNPLTIGLYVCNALTVIAWHANAHAWTHALQLNMRHLFIVFC